jgi:hypothetical protein
MTNERFTASTISISSRRPSRSAKPARANRWRLSFDSLEERTMLSITIAALGDSVTDEYQFYAPYRTAAANWPEIISTLRPTQVDFGAFSATGAGRGQTRNQGYAQDWALQGARAQGNDIVGYGATFVNEYEGGYKGMNLPGLLTQPGGIGNVNVVNILIGGNDYFGAIMGAVQTGINLGNLQKILNSFEEVNYGIIQALQTVVPLIEQANPNTHIIIDTVPSVAQTPIFQTAAAALGPTYGPLLTQFINGEVENVDYNGSPSGGPYQYRSIQQFAMSNNLGYVDDNGLFNAFVANPYFSGQYINPTAAGPVYTDMFVGDGIHPGTIAQGILTNAIISQIDAWYPGAITPLTNAQILQFAQNTQPKAVEYLTASSTSPNVGQQVTLRAGVPTFPANFETSPAPPAMPGPIAYPAPTGVVTFVDGANRNQVLGYASLNATGLATFATTGLSPGLHQITAFYSGNTVYPPAVSATVTIDVGASPEQVKVVNFINGEPQALVRKLPAAKLQTWLKDVRHGTKPLTVERAILRWARLHPKATAGASVTGRSNAVAQREINRL